MKKTALVTGSSQGIGRAIAIKLAKEGYTVFVTFFKHKKKGEKTIKEIINNGGICYLLKTNVYSEKSVRKAINLIKQKVGYLNILINNAGIEIPKDIENINFAEWKKVIETQINGNFLCTKYSLPLMKFQNKANIIIIGSSLGERPNYNYPAYSVGKAAIIAFMKMMAYQLGKYRIRTNIISPGPTQTNMWNSLGGKDDKLWNKFTKNNPMKRISTPEDIANTVLMLINDKSNYLNGNIIYTDGGSHLI